MANEQQLDLINQGVEFWNQWRQDNPYIEIDLSQADLRDRDLGEVDLIGADLHNCNLSGTNLMGADLAGANLAGANLIGSYLSKAYLFDANLVEANITEAYLFEVNLSRANLNGSNLQSAYLGKADLSGAYLIGANLSEADLRNAYLNSANLSDAYAIASNFIGADLQGADLRRADLSNANLMGARLFKTNFEDANLSGCLIYGLSTWGINFAGANQLDLVISTLEEPKITVDNLEVAQFIYLMLNSKKVRYFFPTVTANVVLILGGFQPEERATLLDAIRNILRDRGYLPVCFELEKPTSKDVSETILLLAEMAQFIIADFTQPKSIPPEFERLAPQLSGIPVQLLVQASSEGEQLLKALQPYSWVLEPYYYDNVEVAIASAEEKIILPAETKLKELN